jgi:hypothetical protein
MENLVEKIQRGDPYIYFCPGLDVAKGGKPVYLIIMIFILEKL